MIYIKKPKLSDIDTSLQSRTYKGKELLEGVWILKDIMSFIMSIIKSFLKLLEDDPSN